MKGMITAIQRMSLHDGPGIRSTVFLKGCNFRCRWCHNPETWSAAAQLQHIAGKCIMCGSCVSECPCGALRRNALSVAIDRARCSVCGRCVAACASGALSVIGREVDVATLAGELASDMPYYAESGGGVTLSGGEPLLQAEFTHALLSACKAQHIHTALETNLSAHTDQIEALLPVVDLWMVDLKAADEALHRRYTGASNRQTIENLTFLSAHEAPLIVRTPVIGGVNDNEQEIRAICEILSHVHLLRYELLPFHQLGFDKFPQLGLENPLSATPALDPERLSALQRIVEHYTLNHTDL